MCSYYDAYKGVDLNFIHDTFVRLSCVFEHVSINYHKSIFSSPVRGMQIQFKIGIDSSIIYPFISIPYHFLHL